MKIEAESMNDCRQCTRDAREYAYQSARSMGHEMHFCQCHLCAALRSLEDAQRHLHDFASGR